MRVSFKPSSALKDVNPREEKPKKEMKEKKPRAPRKSAANSKSVENE
jgi:hypothetical protein